MSARAELFDGSSEAAHYLRRPLAPFPSTDELAVIERFETTPGVVGTDEDDLLNEIHAERAARRAESNG